MFQIMTAGHSPCALKTYILHTWLYSLLKHFGVKEDRSYGLRSFGLLGIKRFCFALGVIDEQSLSQDLAQVREPLPAIITEVGHSEIWGVDLIKGNSEQINAILTKVDEHISYNGFIAVNIRKTVLEEIARPTLYEDREDSFISEKHSEKGDVEASLDSNLAMRLSSLNSYTYLAMKPIIRCGSLWTRRHQSTTGDQFRS